MMAKDVMHVSINLRWWVRPYLWVASVFFISVAWALEGDDPRRETFWEKQGNFIAQYGMKVVLS